MTQDSEQKRTIFILYIPGGAMLGIIPTVVLARLEELTETPTIEMFQAFDGVSTGSIVVAGMNVPGISSAVGTELFVEKGASFFPHVPGRYPKMLTANAINIIQDSLDPLKSDALALTELQKTCEALKKKLPESKHEAIDEIEKDSTQRWLTRGRKKKIIKASDEIASEYPELENLTSTIGELVFVRTTTSSLGMIFKKAVLGTMNLVKKYWAKDYLFNPDPPLQTFQNVFGDRRMSDCPRSTYISAYDAQRNKIITFFSRKNDFFSLDADNGYTTSKHDAKLWDAVMASVANPFAFPPHKTEDGVLCSDKAIVHTPLAAVQDVIKHKPADAEVKLVILSTGLYLTENIKNDELKEQYIKNGIPGSILSGRELVELEGYTMSAAKQILRSTLGKDNIIEIEPRLAPHNYAETKEFPSRDVLDASEENIKRIMKRARSLLVEEDDKIRNLAQMLADNLNHLGQMDAAKYTRVSRRIGIKTTSQPLETGIGKEIPNIYERVFGEPTITKVFQKWARGLGIGGGKNKQKMVSPPAKLPAPPKEDEAESLKDTVNKEAAAPSVTAEQPSADTEKKEPEAKQAPGPDKPSL